MKQAFFSFSIITFLFLSACHKSTNTPTVTNFSTVEQQVINDFANNTALPQYDSLVSVATALNNAITNLQTTTTEGNLAIAQTAWKRIRTVWEQCEGFLIGPVEAYDYDPNTDTWPTDHTQMDSLLSSNNPLQVSDIQNLPQNLRGYHPMEYLIFRNGEYVARTAASFTPRELQYLTSLSADILNNNVTPLLQSWISAPVNFLQSVTTAGVSGNPVYPTKLSFFLDVCGDNGMAGICNEVGEADPDGKMYAPYINKDSTITESPYSDNSLVDFKNNIIGAQNVYLGLNGGNGIKDLVAAKNKSLDNQIQAQFTAAINSFDNITERYEQAIFDQRVQVQQTLTQIQTLQALLNGELKDFLQQNVKN
ncbi:MAG TPA: imelysin family protein [Puia sp.]|jgi:putative iron-regulated protein|nr:imelysin family protein [Puia sp.]